MEVLPAASRPMQLSGLRCPTRRAVSDMGSLARGVVPPITRRAESNLEAEIDSPLLASAPSIKTVNGTVGSPSKPATASTLRSSPRDASEHPVNDTKHTPEHAYAVVHSKTLSSFNRPFASRSHPTVGLSVSQGDEQKEKARRASDVIISGSPFYYRRSSTSGITKPSLLNESSNLDSPVAVAATNGPQHPACIPDAPMEKRRLSFVEALKQRVSTPVLAQPHVNLKTKPVLYKLEIPAAEHRGLDGGASRYHEAQILRAVDSLKPVGQIPTAPLQYTNRKKGRAFRRGDEAKVRAIEEGWHVLRCDINCYMQYIPENAKYFVIKSNCELDVYSALKWGIWASTEIGNKRLDMAYRSHHMFGPVFLFFSVSGSGRFCAVAEMTTPVDHSANAGIWLEKRWLGKLGLQFHFVKDIPNLVFRHIRVESNDNKPVTNCRDTTELDGSVGMQILDIFRKYPANTSMLFSSPGVAMHAGA